MIVKLTIFTIAGILITIVHYASYAQNPIRSRLHFAVFMGVVPAIIAAIRFKLGKQVPGWERLAFVYSVLYVALRLIWAELHG